MHRTSRPHLSMLLAAVLMAAGMAATGSTATAAELKQRYVIPLPDQEGVFVSVRVGGKVFTFQRPGRTNQALIVRVSAGSLTGAGMADSPKCAPGAAKVDKRLSLVLGGDSAGSLRVVYRYTPAGAVAPTRRRLVTSDTGTTGVPSKRAVVDVCA